MKLEWPEPATVAKAAWEKWLADIAPEIERIFERAGVKVLGFNPAKAFYEYMEAEIKGKRVKIGLGWIESGNRVKQLEAFLKNIGKAVEAYEEMKNFQDPFHSDIHRILKEKWGGGAGRDFAYQAICDWIQADGRKVWSSTKNEDRVSKIANKIVRASTIIWTFSKMIEFGYDPFSSFLQIGMGGEWWSGKVSPGKNVFHHRKEGIDPAYRPVTVSVRSLGHDLAFDVSGGFGYGAVIRLAGSVSYES